VKYYSSWVLSVLYAAAQPNDPLFQCTHGNCNDIIGMTIITLADVHVHIYHTKFVGGVMYIAWCSRSDNHATISTMNKETILSLVGGMDFSPPPPPPPYETPMAMACPTLHADA
jgi:hypothetical protein